MSQQFSTGVVKWFDPKKGYGFIKQDDGSDDLFAHFRDIEGNGYKNLNENDKVKYVIVNGNNGRPKAGQISVIS